MAGTGCTPVGWTVTGPRATWRASRPLNIVHRSPGAYPWRDWRGARDGAAARPLRLPSLRRPRVFEHVRDAFRDLLKQHPTPDARRDILAQMRETLVRARMGLDDLRRGIAESERRVEQERREVSTMQRRRALADGIADAETLALAVKYEALHAERLAVLERKLAAQRDELAMVEAEVQEMTAEIKLANAGGVPGSVGSAGGSGAVDSGIGGAGSLGEDPLGDDQALRDLDSLDAARRRAEQQSNADEMLQALKRRMGK